MADTTEKIPVWRLTREEECRIETAVAREFPLTIVLNNRELVTMLCLPDNLRYLVIGFLASEGFIDSKDDIKAIRVDDRIGLVRVETNRKEEFDNGLIFKRVISSGCGRGTSFYSAADAGSQKVDSQMKMSTDEVFTLVDKFQHSSELYLTTHGVHSAALCDRSNMLVFSEDIGRHNAIDKIFGKCLLEDIPLRDRAVMTTGRITSEILHKVARRGIPIIISISEPTNLGIEIADNLNITLVASARGKKINVYTAEWRIEFSGKR